MIVIDQINKQYGKHIVLENITVTLPKGGITSIVGANGAGKSTLLSLIGRLLLPSSGSMSVGGINVITANSRILAQTLSILWQENMLTCVASP